jgi:hypothetical protein
VYVGEEAVEVDPTQMAAVGEGDGDGDGDDNDRSFLYADDD